MVWFRKFFGKENEPPKTSGAEQVVRVIHDEQSITVRQPDGREECIAWQAISRVVIRTTDAAPFATDLFWLIEDQEGHGPTIPMGAEGEHELLKTMQRRLDDFDNMAVVEAMGSTENARFVVWDAEGE